MMRHNNNWKWFFAILLVLSIAAAGINFWYNVTHQLKADDLKAAEALWQAKGPANYDLRIRKDINSAAGGETIYEEINAQIRAGRVIKATLNGRELEERLLKDYDVPAWFDYFDRFMEIDTKPGAARVFCDAIFDPSDGHPIRYRRRISSTRDRVALQFEFTPLR